MPPISLPSFKLKGNIIRALDGDTVLVSVKIRLSNVNAPELTAVGGLDAKKRLKNWHTKHDKIVIEVNGFDEYSRCLGRIASDEENGDIFQ